MSPLMASPVNECYLQTWRGLLGDSASVADSVEFVVNARAAEDTFAEPFTGQR